MKPAPVHNSGYPTNEFNFCFRFSPTMGFLPTFVNMNLSALFDQIQKKKTYLCIGLDTDLKKIPRHLLKKPDPLFEFNRQIIDATHEYCVAYKPNIAFYEAEGSKGWEALQKTEAYIPDTVFSIADAKRGDIGNTANLYARAFFEQMNFDAITVAPYMGQDSITPFLKEGKWAIVLAYTSNPGSDDFQTLELKATGQKLYEEVIVKAQQWASSNSIMYVVGAVQTASMAAIRLLAPNYFLLIPGIGAQGGNLEEISRLGMNATCGLLVNASRSIIYSSAGEDFADKAREQAQKIQKDMCRFLNMYL